MVDRIASGAQRAAWRRRTAEKTVRQAQGLAVYKAEAKKKLLIAMLIREGDLPGPTTSVEEIEIALSKYLARQVHA